jgi:hypothetical protein
MNIKHFTTENFTKSNLFLQSNCFIVILITTGTRKPLIENIKIPKTIRPLIFTS